jgi:peptidoglycan hydrolase-like protein with peptidoglycan-binding domain
LVNKIQTALISKGYPLTVNGILDQATKLSIEDFQRENKMAYGDLTLEVLAVLGVR